MGKTIFKILIGIMILMVLLYLYKENQARIKEMLSGDESHSDDSTANVYVPDPNSENPLGELEYKIANYDSFHDKTLQINIWVEMFKACPFWRAFVLDTYNRYKDARNNEGMTLSDRYYYVANEFVEGMGDIEEKYLRCNRTYTRTAGNAEYNSVGINSM